MVSRKGFWTTLSVLMLASLAPALQAAVTLPPVPLEGFVAVNGVRLQYLDWGGSGPALILIHGLGANPHVFDDLAPAFTDRFHVIAYARRGSGNSGVNGPYDIQTLTEDLRELMDALGIAKADLVGHSAGGDEATEMASEHPERVGHIVYLDAAYDWASTSFEAAVKALPSGPFELPPSAMTSLDAFRAYQKATIYPQLDDMRRVEGFLREKVLVQADGSLVSRTPKDLVDALYAAVWSNRPRDYTRVRCPALAIYAEHLYDLHVNDQRRTALMAYEKNYWHPFQERSKEQLQRELPNAEVIRDPGTHGGFFLTDRQDVVDSMRRFLLGSPALAQNGARARR